MKVYQQYQMCWEFKKIRKEKCSGVLATSKSDDKGELKALLGGERRMKIWKTRRWPGKLHMHTWKHWAALTANSTTASRACVYNEAGRGFKFPQEKNLLCMVRILKERGLLFYTAHLETFKQEQGQKRVKYPKVITLGLDWDWVNRLVATLPRPGRCILSNF